MLMTIAGEQLKKAAAKAKRDRWENMFAAQLASLPLFHKSGNPWLRQFQFHPTRKWAFDFAFPQRKLAVEIEGGIWNNGAHVRGAHFSSDCEKYAIALILGWRVLRVTPDMVKSGQALRWVERLLS